MRGRKLNRTGSRVLILVHHIPSLCKSHRPVPRFDPESLGPTCGVLYTETVTAEIFADTVIKWGYGL